MSLVCQNLTIAINERCLVNALSLDLQPGTFVCVLGPNGVGKTLTLHTLAGLRAAERGDIALAGEPMATMDRPAIARQLGLLLQSQEDAFPTTVFDAALMGRHCRLGFFETESDKDRARVEAALQATDLEQLSSRLTSTLSGGERRRAAIATLLVQDPAIMLLDEPMNHLDPLHRLQVMTVFSQLTNEGKIVVASLHDPSLATRFCSHALLLFGDGHWEFGPTSQTLTDSNLERLYATPFAKFVHGDHQVLLPWS